MLAFSEAGGAPGLSEEDLQQVAWSTFIQDADIMIHPYLHWVAQQPPFDTIVPAAILERFAQARQSTRIRNLLWAAELRAIRDHFAATGIPALFAKGAILQRTVYPDIATRPMSDIDLYVRGEDMEQVYGLLTGLGFRSSVSRDSRTPIVGKQANEEAKFRKGLYSGTLSLDVHTVLEMNLGHQVPPWERMNEVTGTDGLRLPCLDIDTALRHICFHLAAHGFEHGLVWLLDIKRFVDHHGDTIPWQAVFDHCEASARPLLACTLTAAAEWLGAKVPRFVLDMAYDNGWVKARTLIWDQIWCGKRVEPVLGVVAALLSGSPRKLWTYLKDRFHSWASPVPGYSHSGGKFMFKRLRTAIGLLASSARAGGLGVSSLRAAKQSEDRMKRLREILWERPAR